MNGIFGIADSRPRGDLVPILRSMAGTLSAGSITQVDPQNTVAIARIQRGQLTVLPPSTSSPAGIDLHFHGTLWNEAMLRRQLEQEGESPGTNVEELLAGLYRAHGTPVFARLNGAFVVVLIDHTAAELVIATDPLGMYPTYWAVHDARLYFAPTVGALLTALSRPDLDLTALAQYMRFQNLLGERTFFEGIRLIPRATVLRFRLRDGSVATERYVSDGATPATTASFADAVDMVGSLLEQAVRRRSLTPRLALFLTGGLDSRLLLAALRRQGSSVHTFTYGAADSRDVVYARRVARLAGSAHHFYPITEGGWVAAHADAHLRSTDGFHPWMHGHGINVLPSVCESADVLFTGWGGGTVVGGWLDYFNIPAATRNDTDLLSAQLFQWFTRYFTWPSLSEAEEYVLYAPELAASLRGRAFASMREEVAGYMSCREDIRAELFFVFNHDFRFLQPWTSMLRTAIDTAEPYFDLDLFRGVYSLPARMRGYRLLMRTLLQRWAPRLSLVPYDRDERLPTTIAPVRAVHGWAQALRHKVNTHVARVFPEYRPLALDYEGWLRSDLKVWGEDLLLSERTLARRLFRPNTLRSLWDGIQSGRPNLIGKVAPIMSYELMLRRFYDPR